MYWDFEEKPTYHGFISDPITKLVVGNPFMSRVKFEDQPTKVFLYDPKYIRPIGGEVDGSLIRFRDALEMYLSYWTDHERSPSYHVVDGNNFDENHFSWVRRSAVFIGKQASVVPLPIKPLPVKCTKEMIDNELCREFMMGAADNGVVFGERVMYTVLDDKKLTARFAKDAFYNIFAYPRTTTRELIKKWEKRM